MAVVPLPLDFWPEAALVRQDLMATLGWTADQADAVIERSSRAYGGHPPADAVATVLHDDFIDTTWPACPIHRRHPLVRRQVGEVAFWACPRNNDLHCRVGDLSPAP